MLEDRLVSIHMRNPNFSLFCITEEFREILRLADPVLENEGKRNMESTRQRYFLQDGEGRIPLVLLDQSLLNYCTTHWLTLCAHTKKKCKH